MKISDFFKNYINNMPPINIFSGEEEYFLNDVRNKIKGTLNPEERSEGYRIFDAEKQDINLLIDELDEVSLFSDKKIIEVINPYFLTAKSSLSDIQKEKFSSYLQNPSNQNILIINLINLIPDKRKKIFKDLNKSSTDVEFNKLNDNEIIKFVKNKLDQDEIKIEDNLVNYFLQRIGFDLNLLDSNLAKIVIFAKDNKVDEEAIDNLVDANPTEDGFALVDSISKNNFKKAINIYTQLIDKGNSPIQINALLLSQYRLMMQIVSSNLDDQTIAQQLKKHPFRVKSVRQAVYGMNYEQVKNMYLKLVEIERNLKSTSLSDQLMFEMLLVQKKTS